MALIRSILGDIHGSAGQLTFSKRNGKNVMRQKVGRNSSNTPAQALQRERFALLSALARLLRPVILVGFQANAYNLTPQNAFLKANKKVISSLGSPVYPYWNQVVLSVGHIAGVVNLSGLFNSTTGEVTFTWEDDSNGAEALPTDIAYIAVVEQKTYMTFIFESQFTRAMQFATATFPALGDTNKFYVCAAYFFFKRADGTDTSPTTVVFG